jgi:hypothetical protein
MILFCFVLLASAVDSTGFQPHNAGSTPALASGRPRETTASSAGKPVRELSAQGADDAEVRAAGST